MSKQQDLLHAHLPILVDFWRVLPKNLYIAFLRAA
jgi:hypothetical protein